MQKTSPEKLPILRPAFKCHGGKSYLKQFIISNFPEDYEKMVFVEPFAGAASVLFNKIPGPEEVLNDLLADFRTERFNRLL